MEHRPSNLTVVSGVQAIVEDFARSKDVELRRLREAVEVELHRDDIVVVVTVPNSVLEWFVDVKDSQGAQIHDWCDYTGYDHTPIDELAQNMADDVGRFLDRISSRPLRVRRTASKSVLEWCVADVWSQAVPLV